MRGVTFPAWRTDGRFVPLIEVVLAVGPWTFGSVRWSVRDSEFGTGRRGSTALAQLAQTGTPVSTLALVDLVSDGVQLVDGEATCFRDSIEEPFIVLASVRGDSWDVYSTEHDVLSAVKRCFDDAADVPFD
jgi:hypothetical protein